MSKAAVSCGADESHAQGSGTYDRFARSCRGSDQPTLFPVVTDDPQTAQGAADSAGKPDCRDSGAGLMQ